MGGIASLAFYLKGAVDRLCGYLESLATLPCQVELEAMLSSWVGPLPCFPAQAGCRICCAAAWHLWPGVLLWWDWKLSSAVELNPAALLLCLGGALE